MDIQTGPNGNVFVVSLSNGAVYEIFRRSSRSLPPGEPTSRPTPRLVVYGASRALS